MRPEKLYLAVLSVVYAILLVLGNLDDLTPQGQWRAQAAAWLGEPPAGLQVETWRAGFRGDYPTTLFSIPANEELRSRIIDTYRLELAGTTDDGEVKYGNRQVLPAYTDDTRPVLTGVSVVITPWLLVKPDGSMLFCADDINVEQGGGSGCLGGASIPALSAPWRVGVVISAAGIGGPLFPVPRVLLLRRVAVVAAAAGACTGNQENLSADSCACRLYRCLCRFLSAWL